MTMSGMLAKTWNYLHQVTLDPSPGWSVPSKDQRHHLPSGLATWLHQVTSCLDKTEEQALVQRQLEIINSKLNQKNVSQGVASDCLVRLVYIYLLGYDCSSSYVHCVKLAGAGSILSRKMGYLACSVMIPSTHELLLMLTNTILRDISSNNLVDIQLGLVAAGNLVTQKLVQLVPVLVDRVIPLLKHSSHLVRKKSVTLLDYLCKLEAGQWERSVSSHMVNMLCDTNPGVVTFAVQTLSNHMSPADGQDNVKIALLAIIQLHNSLAVDNMLPSDYQYRGYQAPHLQIYCIRLYRKTASIIIGDNALSDNIVSLLQSCLNVYTGCKDLIIQALLYETVLTISSIPSAQCLIPLAVRGVSNFLGSKHHSTVYTGLCALDTLLRHHQCVSLSNDQESAVLSCLSHSDQGIQRRAAELLVLAASRSNVMSIVDRVLSHVAANITRSDYSMVVDRLILMVEKFGDTVQDCDWRASTLLRIVQVTKHEQRDKMMERLKLLLTQCDEGDAAAVLELNRVRIKLRALLSDIIRSREKSNRQVPAPVISLKIWCDAQFYCPEDDVIEDIVNNIVDTANDNGDNALVMRHCIGALQSLLMRHGTDIIGQTGAQLIKQTCESHDDGIKEAALMCQTVMKHAPRSSPPPVQSSPDLTLSFLDSYVITCLKSGRHKVHVPKLHTHAHVTNDDKKLLTSPYNLLSVSRESSSLSSRNDGNTTPVTMTLWTEAGRVETEDHVDDEVNRETFAQEMETVKDKDIHVDDPGVSVLTGDWD